MEMVVSLQPSERGDFDGRIMRPEQPYNPLLSPSKVGLTQASCEIAARGPHLLTWRIERSIHPPRSLSNALLPFFGGGFPYFNRLQKKVGTLILTSLLEDLAPQGTSLFSFDSDPTGRSERKQRKPPRKPRAR